MPGTSVARPTAVPHEPAALAVLLVCIATLLGRVPDWRAELGRFQALLGVAFVVYALSLVLRARWRKLPGRATFVVLVGLAMRAAVFPSPPSLSDDLYRYAWEGRVLAGGGNPYAHAPADPALARFRDTEVYPRVNHPELSAIYPPLAEAGFALVATLGHSLAALKLWVVLHDLALCALLAKWCERRGGSAWDAIAYAWNPLVVTEYAGSGHHDPTGILWLVAALAWAERRPAASACAAIGAVMIKWVALPVLPFIARAWPVRVRLLGAALLGLLVTATLWLSRGPASGLSAFAARWRHNASVFDVLAALSGERPARFIVAALFAGVLVVALARRWDAVAGARTVLRGGLLLSPVLHPWYLGWVLALEPLAVSPAWLLLSCTVSLSYGAFAPPAAGGGYHPSAAWRWVEYGLPAALAGVMATARRGWGMRVRTTP